PYWQAILVVALVTSPRGLSQVLMVLDKHPGFRVTLVPPEQGWGSEAGSDTVPVLTRRVKALVSANRIELALGLSARPLLPLIHETGLVRISTPSDDVEQLLSDGLHAFERTWGFSPKGFVAPEGAVAGAVDGELRRVGFQWVVAALGGPLGGPSVVLHDQPVYFDGSGMGTRWAAKGSKTPSQWLNEVVQSPERSSGPVIMVFAESPTLPGLPLPQRLPDISLLPLVAELSGGAERADNSRHIEWVTPSQWVHEKRPVEVWKADQSRGFGGQTWDAPNLTRWTGRPAQATAWRWYAECREVVERYRVSSQADRHRINAALAELRPLVTAEWFERLGQDEASAEWQVAERYFTAGIVHAYRLIGQPPPPELDQLGPSLIQGTTTSTAVSTGTTSAIQFRGTRDLVGVTVSWTNEEYRFAIQLREPANPQKLPLGWSGVIVDVYLDVNHREGAGTTSLLPDRHAVTPPQDAWEYAMTLTSEGASFYRTLGSEGAVKIAELPVEVRQPDRTVVVRVPASLLRGDPWRWGYLVLVMGEDHVVYDILDTPWDPQASHLTPPPGGRPMVLPMVHP
ncbi:MAG: hypothetical protein HYZ73_02450, partial [Elusimicrobia bacterium]|nr:hypothetical protein [Elusimicrobiota bacterium]